MTVTTLFHSFLAADPNAIFELPVLLGTNTFVSVTVFESSTAEVDRIVVGVVPGEAFELESSGTKTTLERIIASPRNQ